MSFLKNKLFRWKQKQRIPKKEWPELVGKVTYFNFEFFQLVTWEPKVWLEIHCVKTSIDKSFAWLYHFVVRR